MFSLIVQEETQKDIRSSSSSSNEPMAFAVRSDIRQSSDSGKSRFQKKDRPICSHCNVLGHTKDKCFKIHSYPPNYPFKPKTQPSVNQVSDSATTPSQNVASSLTIAQC